MAQGARPWTSKTSPINATPDTLDPGATGLALTLLISFALFDPLVIPARAR